jgi:hypothetical protein
MEPAIVLLVATIESPERRVEIELDKNEVSYVNLNIHIVIFIYLYIGIQNELRRETWRIVLSTSLVPIKWRWVYELNPMAGCDRGIALGDEWARGSSGKNVAGVWGSCTARFVQRLDILSKDGGDHR